jgi:hypothetical protein
MIALHNKEDDILRTSLAIFSSLLIQIPLALRNPCWKAVKGPPDPDPTRSSLYLFFPALASFFLLVKGMLYFLFGYKNLSIRVHYDIKNNGTWF